MKKIELKVARIGNSRGVRLPAASLRRYRIGGSVIMEEMIEGILLRPSGPAIEIMSWADTAREMAAAREDWSEWEGTTADGLDEIPWESGSAQRIAERRSKYAAKPRTAGKK